MTPTGAEVTPGSEARQGFTTTGGAPYFHTMDAPPSIPPGEPNVPGEESTLRLLGLGMNGLVLAAKEELRERLSPIIERVSEHPLVARAMGDERVRVAVGEIADQARATAGGVNRNRGLGVLVGATALTGILAFGAGLSPDHAKAAPSRRPGVTQIDDDADRSDIEVASGTPPPPDKNLGLVEGDSGEVSFQHETTPNATRTPRTVDFSNNIYMPHIIQTLSEKLPTSTRTPRRRTPTVTATASRTSQPTATVTEIPFTPTATATHTATPTIMWTPTATDTATPQPTDVPTPTETPRSAETVPYLADTEALLSPDSESRRNLLVDAGSGKYLGSVYQDNEVVAEVIEIDGEKFFVAPEKVTIDTDIRHEYGEPIPWREQTVVDQENSPTGRVVELEAVGKNEEGPVLGSATFLNRQEDGRVSNFNTTVSFQVGLVKKQEGVTPTPTPGAADKPADSPLNPKVSTYVESFGANSSKRIAALVVEKGQLYLEIYHDGQPTERELVEYANGTIQKTEIAVEDNGHQVAVYRTDQEGKKIELHRMNRIGGIEKDHDRFRVGRSAEGGSAITVAYAETAVAPNYDMGEQPRRRSEGLAQAAGPVDTGLRINNLKRFFDSPDSLLVLRRELKRDEGDGKRFIHIGDSSNYYNYKFAVQLADARRQAETIFDELGVDYFLWLDGDPQMVNATRQEGVDVDNAINSILAPHTGNRERKVVIGRAIDGNGQLKSESLARDLAARIATNGNTAFTSPDDGLTVAGLYWGNGQRVTSVAQIPQTIPNITGLVYNAHVDEVGWATRDAQKVIDKLQRKVSEQIGYRVVHFGGIEPTNQNCDGCSTGETIQFLLDIATNNGIPLTFAVNPGEIGGLRNEYDARLYYTDDGVKLLPNNSHYDTIRNIYDQLAHSGSGGGSRHVVQ